jgi:ribonuclease P protein component
VLKKINRIGSKKDFLEIKNKGQMYYSPIFGLLTLKKEDEEKKFGFIISKKISKRAVDRNKIKRYLSEAVRRSLKDIKEGTRGVFLVKREILNKKLEEIVVEVEKIFKK